MKRNFLELLETKWSEGKFVCVGLDIDLKKIPDICGRSGDVTDTVYNFAEAIVEATQDVACAYKPNTAFFEALGTDGWDSLFFIFEELVGNAPWILDAKRADIGSTNIGYAEMAFDRLGADAITVHPYMGYKAMSPFLDRGDKGVFVLCRTSNAGADEFQDFATTKPNGDRYPLYEYIAERVDAYWNYNGNCGLVVGATAPYELRRVRGIAPTLPILIPGIGVQGGDLEKAVRAGKDSRGRGFIINASRSIIYASSGVDFADAARREALKLHNAIQVALS